MKKTTFLKVAGMSLALFACQTTKAPGTVCPGTRMVGWERPEDMTETDKIVFENTKERCAIKYPDRRSPCLKELRKVGPTDYVAICGKPRE